MASETQMQDPKIRERMKDGRYQFTEEEQQALRECRFESFWYRAFPLASAAGISTHFLVQRGALNASKRFGSVPKVMFASVCGYVIGKMLYVGQCRDKFLKLENSPFADMIRRGKGGMPSEAGFGGLSISGYTGEPSGGDERQSDSGYRYDRPWSGTPDNHLNMDIDTSHVKGMDDSFTSDLPVMEEKDTSKPEMTMTYDELRRRSREKNSQQYTQVLPGHYQPKQTPSQPADSTMPPLAQPEQQRIRAKRQPPPQDEFTLGARNRSKMVNQYGDVWEKE
ncbi:OCIA domain-containing protein 1-like [Diadema setosum]|uniref:OCIA domain-containing protein 1-like n=1 Tax=Diadema setosum TaxID=31175 RepID=UPI003B3A4679